MLGGLSWRLTLPDFLSPRAGCPLPRARAPKGSCTPSLDRHRACQAADSRSDQGELARVASTRGWVTCPGERNQTCSDPACAVGAKCKRLAELGLAGNGTPLRCKDIARCGARTRKGTPTRDYAGIASRASPRIGSGNFAQRLWNLTRHFPRYPQIREP